MMEAVSSGQYASGVALGGAGVGRRGVGVSGWIRRVAARQANVEASEGKDSGRARTQENPKPKQPRIPRARRFSFRLTTGKVLLVGVVLLPVALISGIDILAWLGIGLIVTAYVMYFTRPRRTVERRWRGQLIEDQPEPNVLQRLWHWLTRS